MNYSRHSFFLPGFDPHHHHSGLIGRSLLSRRQAPGCRWCCNLWPLLPAHRLGANATPVLSSSLQAAASGPHCHLGSYWHPEPAPTWQQIHTAGAGHCHLTVIGLSFCTTLHVELIQIHRRTLHHTHVEEMHFLIFRSFTGIKLGAEIKDYHFYISLSCICMCLLVCKATSLCLSISISYFPGYLDGLYSGPDHMIALASYPCVHREIGRRAHYSIWPF